MNIDHHESFQHMIDESLAGGISAEREQSLREHLNTCAPCREYLSASNSVIAGLGGFSFEVDPTLNARVFASLRRPAQRVRAAQPGRRRWVLISVAAVVLTMGGSFVDLQFGSLVASLFDIQRMQVLAGAACFLDCALAVFLTAVSAIAFAIESRHSPERKDFMKLLSRFLNIVPKTVQFWAVVPWAVPS